MHEAPLAAPRPTRLWQLLVAVFAIVGFAQTMLYYVLLSNDPGNYNSTGSNGDQVAYIELAQQILRLNWEGLNHYMPGFPLLLAVAQLVFGDPRLGVAVLQGLMFVAMVWFGAAIARRLWGAAAGLWAAALMALNPAMGFNAGQALTEFTTATLLFATVATLHAWWARANRSGRADIDLLVVAGLLLGAVAYVRSEYLFFSPLIGLGVVYLARSHASLSRSLSLGLLVVAIALGTMLPWVARYWIATGQPTIYNISATSNLILMGTWFRSFDEQTFAELQIIDKSPLPNALAIERAGTVGPRPDLSARYMSQLRGPYDRPIGETLSLALGNIQGQTAVWARNHLLLAPVLIWAGRTPLRGADLTALPTVARLALWGLQGALFLLAVWQAVLALRDRDSRALALTSLAVILFLTAVHVVIAVDERFTAPALPLLMLLAGGAFARILSLFNRTPKPATLPA